MKECKTCLNTKANSQVRFNENSVCSQCQDHQVFEPNNDSELRDLFRKVKNKKLKYDALVPTSGGKDSTYVLYLATKKYGLKVLAYTLDNGFLSDLAKKNIEESIKKAGVDHIWYKIPEETLYKSYRRSLLKSGELCGVCGVAIERSMLKVSERYKIPLILLGHSPAEAHSFTKENIYDPVRLKSILKSKEITRKEINEIIVYPRLNYISSFLYTKLGRFGKKINLLYYLPLKSDNEIAQIIKKEMGWKDSDHSAYTRHLDCLAEPFTNYIRDNRLGSSRRLPQINNMIRNGEINKDEAQKILLEDAKQEIPANYNLIKETLKISENDIQASFKVPLGAYAAKESISNKVFAIVRKWVK